jgi:hypothetical protein
MSNTIQLKRSSLTGAVPLLADLAQGELAFNSADNSLFISDGSAVHQINAPAYLAADENRLFVTPTQVSTWGAKQDAIGYATVNKAGDTLLGALILAGDPLLANQASTKHYVDGIGDLAVPLAGGTMSGALVLAADPSANLGAATKQYVDGAVNNISGIYASPVADAAALEAITEANYIADQLRMVDSAAAIFRFVATSVEAANGVSIVIPNDITAPAAGRWIMIQAATQDHDLLRNLQGGAANDFVHLTTAEKNGYDAHTASTVLHLTSTQDTWLNALNASATEVNYLIDVTSPIQTQLGGKEASIGYTTVNKAGDTMLGILTLSADPVNPLDAATRQFVLNATIDGGTY